MKQPAGVPAIRFRRAVGFVRAIETAEHIVFGRPTDIVAHEKIEVAVAVIVKPQRRSTQSLAAEETTGTRGVYKSTLAGIAEETALANASDKNVGKSIVVVIPDSRTHSVHFDVQASALCDVSKRAVAIVAVELQGRALALVAGPVHAVQEQDVLPTVGVVIQERAARAERFGKQLSTVRAGVVLKLDSRSRSDVGESKAQIRSRT